MLYSLILQKQTRNFFQNGGRAPGAPVLDPPLDCICTLCGHCKSMVVHFCHHLSDKFVDLSDLYVNWSVIHAELSYDYVDLSKYHHNCKLLYLAFIACSAPICHLHVILISDKSTSISDQQT